MNISNFKTLFRTYWHYIRLFAELVPKGFILIVKYYFYWSIYSIKAKEGQYIEDFPKLYKITTDIEIFKIKYITEYALLKVIYK